MTRSILSVPSSWPVAPDLWRAVVQLDRPVSSGEGKLILVRRERKLKLDISGLLKEPDGTLIRPGQLTCYFGVTWMGEVHHIEAGDLVGPCDVRLFAW